jgi:D-citramalate synthase
MEKRKIEIMDTTPVMVNKPQESFFCCEKLTIAQLLLEELNVDRIEIASARVRRRISRSDNGLSEHQRIRKPHRSFNLVDGGLSIEWMKKGAKVQNLLTKDQ